MSHVYYALYNKETLDLISISGSEFTEVPNEASICKVYEKDGVAFNTGLRMHNEYIVVVDENSYAKFKYKYTHEVTSRPIVRDNVVQDLDYQMIFFDYLGIKFSQLDDDEGILLEFDIDQLDQIYQENFKNSISQGTLVDFYITKYQDISALLETYEVDLNRLSQTKTGILPFITKEKISIWAARK